MGPSPATGWEGFKQLEADTTRKVIEPQGGPFQVLGWGDPGLREWGGGPPGGTLVFLEHLGIRLLLHCDWQRCEALSLGQRHQHLHVAEWEEA